MAIVSSADRARARSVLERIERLSERIQAIAIPPVADIVTDINIDANVIQSESVRSVLGSMPIDALRPLSTTGSYYPPAGCSTVGDLFSLRADGTLSIDLNHADSDTVLAANRLYGEVRHRTPFIVGEASRPSAHTKLIGDVVRYDLLKPLEESLGRVRSAVGVCESMLSPVRDATTFAGSFLISKSRKDTILSSIESSERALADLESRVTYIESEFERVFKLTDNDLWFEFARNRPRYESILKSITGLNTNGVLPRLTTSLAIEAYDLDVRLSRAIEVNDSIALDSMQTEHRKLKCLVQEQRKLEAIRKLRGISVDVLANGGARISPLKKAGFKNLEQLYGMRASILAGIQGLTSTTAGGILHAVDDIYRSAYETSHCRLDLQAKPAHQEQLVKGLYASSLLTDLRTRHRSLTSELDVLHKRMAPLAATSNYVDNLFLDEDSVESVSRLLDELRNTLPVLESQLSPLASEAEYAGDPPVSEAWKYFTLNAATCYAKIEALGGGSFDETAAGLPKRLVDKVAALILDTSFMKATLRSYQKFAAKYMLKQGHTLIGDEMGLGKTVEAVAAMAHLAACGETHFVVVCPLSVLVNWVREIPTHSELRSISIHGADRNACFTHWCLHGGVAVTTYETVSRLDWNLLKDIRLSMVVVDEAHYIKNPAAKRTKAIAHDLMPLARRVTFLTGTPLENRVEEMNNLLFLLNPTLVRSGLSSINTYNPIEYRSAISTVYLRRKREDVLDELPSKIEKRDWCTPSRADLDDYYHALYEGSFSALRRVGWGYDDISRSAKAERLKEICTEAKADGSKVLVFSFYLDTLDKVAHLCGDDCVGIINGRVPAPRRQQLVDEFSRSDKTVLVSQVTAGGVGLNIQAANIIIFCEPQIKPSMEDQAISRSYRMGQVRTVVVHRLLMDDTVDERIEEILDIKRREFRTYADKSQIGQESLGIIDTRTIIDMIEAERKRHNVQNGKTVNARR